MTDELVKAQAWLLDFDKWDRNPHASDKDVYDFAYDAKPLVELITVLIGRNNELQEEVDVDNKLLDERNRLLAAIPECPEHGACVPHAIEWVENAKALVETLRIVQTSLEQQIAENLELRKQLTRTINMHPFADGWNDPSMDVYDEVYKDDDAGRGEHSV